MFKFRLIKNSYITKVFVENRIIISPSICYVKEQQKLALVNIKYCFCSNIDKQSIDTNDQVAPKEEKLSFKQKFVKLFKQYGFPFLIYWHLVWALSGIGIYFVISAVGDDIVIAQMKSTINYFNLQGRIDMDNMDPKWGNIGVAFLINESLELIRFPFVIATMPWILKLLKRK